MCLWLEIKSTWKADRKDARRWQDVCVFVAVRMIEMDKDAEEGIAALFAHQRTSLLLHLITVTN